MSDTCDAPASDLMVELECLYRETGNPKYAWCALLEECEADKPLPSWIRYYLRGCAAAWLTENQPPWRWPEPEQGSCKPGHRGLLDLFDAVRDDELDPDEAARAVPRALGLTRDNRNAFADSRELGRQAAIAAHYERNKRKGSSDGDLLAIEARVGKSRSTVKRWIQEIQRLWAAQARAKGSSAPMGK